MNSKHIACLAVLFFCVVIAQGVSIVRKRAIDMQAASDTARREAEEAAVALRTQRSILDDLKRKSADLLAYLDAWEAHFSSINSAESAELNISALVKKTGLVLLAQRFEAAPNKSAASVPNAANETIPQVIRAHLTSEDEFTKTINWLGEVKSKLPSARLSNLSIARGQSGNDLRMDVVIDVPLARPRNTLAPAP